MYSTELVLSKMHPPISCQPLFRHSNMFHLHRTGELHRVGMLRLLQLANPQLPPLLDRQTEKGHDPH